MESYSKEKEFMEKLLDSYLRVKTNQKEKLGIPDNGYIFHNVGKHQNRKEEFLKTVEFLN